MSIARMRHDWDQTGLIWATIANAHRDPKKQKKPFLPQEANPFRKVPKRKEYDISILKLMLPGNNGQQDTSRTRLH